MSAPTEELRGDGRGKRGEGDARPEVNKMVTMTIDGKQVNAREGAYVLEAARSAGIEIPTLCHHEALEPYGGCRLCVVDVTKEGWDGWRKLVISCQYPIEEGLVVFTASERVLETRRVVLDLLLARCPDTPLVQELAHQHGIENTTYRVNPEPTDCILCALCTRVCDHLGVSAIATVNRGVGREIAPPFYEAPPDCIGCLACAEICPTDYIPHSTSAESRTIWGRTFEMLRCTRCGRAYITVEQATYYAGRNGVPRSYFDTCDLCKRREMAATSANLAAGVRAAV